MTTTSSRNQLVAALQKIIDPARLVSSKHFPAPPGESWEQNCPGAMLGTSRLRYPNEFTTLSELPDAEDWQIYLTGKLLGVQRVGVATSMEVRDTKASPPVYGGGFSNSFLTIAFRGLIDSSIDGVALTGGMEVWDQATLAAGLMRTFGHSDLMYHILHWDAPGVTACAQEEGLDRPEYQAFMHDMMRLVDC